MGGCLRFQSRRAKGKQDCDTASSSICGAAAAAVIPLASLLVQAEAVLLRTIFFSPAHVVVLACRRL
jgi:hypothetical protein